jgi:hypothetical protein
MNDDMLLITIDDTIGASSLCPCGKELRVVERGRTVWLECPAFAIPSRLPARVAAFLLESAHDRRPVAELPSNPSGVSATPASAQAPVARPVAVHG